MKRILIILATIAAALTLMLGANPASAQYLEGGGDSPDGPWIKLSANKVEAGGSVTVDGGGFDGGATVRIDIESDPVFLANATAKADGTFSATVTIPADIPLGAHEIVATGPGEDGELVLRAAIEVVAPGTLGGGGGGGGGTGAGTTGGGGALARTGSNVLPLVGIGGAALLLGAAFIYGARKPSEA